LNASFWFYIRAVARARLAHSVVADGVLLRSKALIGADYDFSVIAKCGEYPISFYRHSMRHRPLSRRGRSAILRACTRYVQRRLRTRLSLPITGDGCL
jgi:hypothetical protein